MLLLLGFGAILALLAGLNVIGFVPKGSISAMIVRDDEYLDFSKVPESRGMPTALYRVVIVGLLIIFAIGASVVLDSRLRPPLAGEHDAARPPEGNTC